VTGIFARPLPSSGLRRAWNLGHYGVGWMAIFLGIANVYLGLVDEAHVDPQYVAAYSVVCSLCSSSRTLPSS
jgi:hypothetical protein